MIDALIVDQLVDQFQQTGQLLEPFTDIFWVSKIALAIHNENLNARDEVLSKLSSLIDQRVRLDASIAQLNMELASIDERIAQESPV